MQQNKFRRNLHARVNSSLNPSLALSPLTDIKVLKRLLLYRVKRLRIIRYPPNLADLYEKVDICCYHWLFDLDRKVYHHKLSQLDE